MALKSVTISPPIAKSQLAPGAGVSSNAGVVAVALTRSRIHIPEAPCPGTPQKIKYSPAGCAVKPRMSFASEGSPAPSFNVKARGMAGSTDCVGSGVRGAMTSALWGNIPSWLRKSISVFHPTGTSSVSAPSRNPLKFRAPFSPVSPAINWKRTVLAAVSKLSQVGSTRCCWALAGTASERVTNPTLTARPTAVDRSHVPAGGLIPSLGIVPHPSVELRFHHTQHRSLIVFFFSFPQLCRERMHSREDDDRDCRTDQAPAEDPDPGELPESEMRKQDSHQCEHEFYDGKPERHGHDQTRLPRRAVDAGHDDHAVREVEQVMHRREQGDAAQHREGANRFTRDCIDHGKPDPDAGRDDESEPGALPQ